MRRRAFLTGGAQATVLALTHPLYAVARPRVGSAGRPSVDDVLRGEGADARPEPRSVASPPGETRLYANENPYGPPPAALEAMAEVLPLGNRYGRYGSEGRLMEPGELEARIAAREGVPDDHVLVSHGATELLQLSAVAYGGGGLVAPVPTYGSILGYQSALSRPVDIAPLSDEFRYDLDRLLEGAGGDASLTYVCHPNNPTGLLEAQEDLEAFCREASRESVVVVDEAYYELVEAPGYRSLVHLVRDGSEVVVLRTFSKAYGMAGLRVGYAIGRPELLQPLRRLQVGPINVVSLVGARAALRSEDFLAHTRSRIASTRKRLYRELDGMGLRRLDSVTNFVMVDAGRPAREVLAALHSRGVRVNGTMQRSSSWIRVTVGTDEEIDRFLEALRDVVE